MRSSRKVSRRRFLAIITTAAVSISFGLWNVLPAHAVTSRMTIGSGLASCPSGYVCLWTLSNFTGSGYAFFNSETNYAGLPAPFNGIQDNSWSFYNNGATSDIEFYRDANYSGGSFVLCKGQSIAALPPNSSINPPTLRSDGTNEPGRPWRDQISSHHFGTWC